MTHFLIGSVTTWVRNIMMAEEKDIGSKFVARFGVDPVVGDEETEVPFCPHGWY